MTSYELVRIVHRPSLRLGVFFLFFFEGFPIHHVPFRASFHDVPGIGRQSCPHFPVNFCVKGQFRRKHPFDFPQHLPVFLGETAMPALLERSEGEMREMAGFVVAEHA
ncbi:MAG: hypothetical protein K0S45_2550 [Nitrospira sp.]|nr:hypothetical protein [Nitrospira sp.]